MQFMSLRYVLSVDEIGQWTNAETNIDLLLYKPRASD